ncbi:MAG TPA: YecA family protein [Woeseiaceae bacterium]|nr:YecA family protein [Woeseiaceae bacterium]
MEQGVDHDELDRILRRCGATWNASQAHGFLCSRIAVRGTAALSPWLKQLLAGTGKDDSMGGECAKALESLFHITWRSLAERQSEFVPVLPEDDRPAAERADGLAHWCEGFLHGLVSGPHPEALRAQLATEPLSDIIKDMLEITRAAADDEANEESNDEAYAELVEYIRVAAQLAFEELAGFRAQEIGEAGPDAVH